MIFPIPGWRRDFSQTPLTGVDLRVGWRIYRNCEYRENDPSLMRIHGLDRAWVHEGSPVTPTHWRLSKNPAGHTEAPQGARETR